MLQRYAMNGEYLYTPVKVKHGKSLGFMTTPPHGLVGVDIKNGLVEVVREPNSKPVMMKYGKLLKQLGNSDEVVKNESTKLTTLKLACSKTLRFTTSSEEVIDVYRRGPQSCMKNSDAVAVYATEDVAVAYIEDEDHKVLARTVVCINEDIGLHYVHCYGFSEPLEYLLEKRGYGKGDLGGCSILKLEDGTGIKAPYLDGYTGLDDEGDYFRIVKYGDFDATSTTGYLNMCRCEHCEDNIHEDEGRYSEYLNQVLCESCYDECHVYIDGESYHVNNDDIQRLEDGEYALVDEAVYVDYRSEYHHRDDCRYNSYLEEYVLNEDLR